MTILYKLGNNLYVNITNACQCDCIFCIRNGTEGMNENESLWLEREPSLDEILAAFEKFGEISKFDEVVFCGFGEPLMRHNVCIATAKHIKKKYCVNVRLNTNGLVRLVFPDFDMSELAVFDAVSVSLNADTPEEYLRVTRPNSEIANGTCAYNAMLSFAKDAKQYTNVALSVVGILDPKQIENCRRIAQSLNVPFRVR